VLGLVVAWTVMAFGCRRRWFFLSSGSCRPRSSLNDDDEFSLPQLSRGSHASFDDSSKTPRKNKLPDRGSGISGVFFIMKRLYNTFSAKIKALWHRKTVAVREKVKAVDFRPN
jgi:hypothetical protein